MDKLDNETILELVMMMGSDAILTQQKHGQGQVVMNEVLPVECDKPAFESLGFVFGDKADDLFYNVRFPDGWKREATDHSMWTDIVDEKGRKRGSIGYKSAFYDRWANAGLSKRYGVRSTNLEGEYLSTGETGYSSVVDWDGKELYQTEEHVGGWRTKCIYQDKCDAWLDDMYPEWKSPLAYWD